MAGRNYRDIAAGSSVIVFGLFVAFYASANYTIGTVSRMGPGMFPVSLGFILALLGVLIFVPAILKLGYVNQNDEPVALRPLITILAGVAAFGLLVVPFGMVPAIIALTLIATFADSRLGIVGALILSLVLATIAYVVFTLALGMTLSPFAWPD